MGYPIGKNRVGVPMFFKMRDVADHVTGVPGLAPTVELDINGSGFAAVVGSTSDHGHGWYAYSPDATEIDTEGMIVLRATAAGCDESDDVFPIWQVDPMDPFRMNMTALPAYAATAGGPVLTQGTGAGQLVTTAGKVSLDSSAFTTLLGTTLLSEAYPADGAQATLAELLYLLLANLTQFDVVGTSLVARKLNGTTAAAAYLLDDPVNPTSRTRVS